MTQLMITLTNGTRICSHADLPQFARTPSYTVTRPHSPTIRSIDKIDKLHHMPALHKKPKHWFLSPP